MLGTKITGHVKNRGLFVGKGKIHTTAPVISLRQVKQIPKQESSFYFEGLASRGCVRRGFAAPGAPRDLFHHGDREFATLFGARRPARGHCLGACVEFKRIWPVLVQITKD